MNSPSAGWCGRCHARFATVEAPPVGPIPVAPTATPRRRPKLGWGYRSRLSLWIRLGLLAIGITARVIVPLVGGVSAAGGSNLHPGTLDSRGFQPLYSDPGSGEPVRYNACAPLHYVINPTNAPADAIDKAHAAIKVVSKATGIKFVYNGETSETYSTMREAHQPDRYGDRWAPILLDWSAEPLYHDTQGDVIGMAASDHAVNDNGNSVFVTGIAVFDASDDMRYGVRPPWDEVILHELGHVVGLGHIEDPASLMHPTIQQRPPGYGKGDMAGLWTLGLGSRCLDTPPVP